MENVYAAGAYTVKHHNEMGYAVFKQANGFQQQVSGWYRSKTWAIKICERRANYNGSQNM